MKNLGYLLLVGGFLCGAFATALSVDVTQWGLFLPAAVAATAGVWMIKRRSRGEATAEHVLTANRSELRESLGNIVATLGALQGANLQGAALRDRIDDELRNELRRFAEARESIVHLFGLQAYADIMSDFAAGERYVNRVWSASADGYDEEARAYLERALRQFGHASDRLQAAAAP